MEFIEILKVLFLGIIEGITEWLPISSTGHLILAENFIPMNVSDEFFKMFEVVIQFGSIIAVLLLFWNKLSLSPYSAKEFKASASKTSLPS